MPPITWLENTFPTRSKTEELLKPEVEAGIITPHDFELAKDFLPGDQRYWPWFGLGAGFVTGAWYTQVYKRPPLNLYRANLLIAALGATGHSVGTALKFRAHLRFTTSLEDPDNFVNALENVNRKQGNPRPLGFTLAAVKSKKQPESDLDPVQSHEFEEGSGLEFVNENDLPPEPNSNPPESTKTQIAPIPQDQWSRIRTAHLQNKGQMTSWDVLRSRSMQRIQNRNVQEEDERLKHELTEDQRRATEQAEFDAMLEAERKIASGS